MELDEVIDLTIESLISGTVDTVTALENRIAEILTNNPQASRAEIMGVFEQYAQLISGNTNQLNSISEAVIQTQIEQGIFGGVTPEDTRISQLLVEDAAGTVRETVISTAEAVIGIAVAGVVTNAAIEDIIRESRGSISGVLMQTGDPEITAKQSRLRAMIADPNRDQEEFAQLLRELREAIPAITAGSLTDQLRGLAENITMRFTGAFIGNRSARAGIERYTYGGGVISTTRPFCEDLVGQTLTRDEMDQRWQDSWAGKSGSNPFVDRGGYNCRHYWIPVSEDE